MNSLRGTAAVASALVLAVAAVWASSGRLAVEVTPGTPEGEPSAVGHTDRESRQPPAGALCPRVPVAEPGAGAAEGDRVVRIRDELGSAPLSEAEASLVTLAVDPAGDGWCMGEPRRLGVSDDQGRVAVSRADLANARADTSFVMLRRDGYVPRLVPGAALSEADAFELQPCAWVSVTSMPEPDSPAGFTSLVFDPSREGAAVVAGTLVLLPRVQGGYVVASPVERTSVTPGCAVFGFVPGLSYELRASARVGRSLMRATATVCPPAPVALRLEEVPTHVVRLVPRRDPGRAFVECRERGSVPVSIEEGVALIDLRRLSEHVWTFHASGADWKLERPLCLDLTGGYGTLDGRESTVRTVAVSDHVLALDLAPGLFADEVELCAPVGELGDFRVLEAVPGPECSVHVTRQPDGLHVRGVTDLPARLFLLCRGASCAVPLTLFDPIGRTAVAVEAGRACELDDGKLRELTLRFGHDASIVLEQEVAWPDGCALWIPVASPTRAGNRVRVPWVFRVHDGRRYRLCIRAPNGSVEVTALGPGDFRDA